MPVPGPCAACGETLQGVVRFCPFCGMSQQVVAGPAAIAAADAGPSRPPSPPPRPETPPLRVVPLVSPPVQPAPVQPPPMMPPPGTPPAQAAPPPPPRILTVAQRRARREALRKLLLAAVMLGCGGILWRHLADGPHATLIVHLTRQADGAITVDGRPAGAPDDPVRLAPGRHVIGFRSPAWSTEAVSVRLRDGETRSIELAPVPHRATLAIDSIPSGARLTVGTRRLGHAPASVTLVPGPVRVVASMPGYRTLDQELVLGPGELRRLTLALPPEPQQVVHLLALPGAWTQPLALAHGDRFTLRLSGRVRLRNGGRVFLLEGGNPAELGALDDTTLSFSAVDAAPVALDLIIHKAGSPG